MLSHKTLLVQILRVPEKQLCANSPGCRSFLLNLFEQLGYTYTYIYIHMYTHTPSFTLRIPWPSVGSSLDMLGCVIHWFDFT